MKRLIDDFLIKWKNSDSRIPLIILGARQVGKTYTIKQFGETFYEDIIIVNFESDDRFKKYFDNDFNTSRIINNLENHFMKRILPGRTLIFFDEIQYCPRAITSLKYFCENANDYHIICAGSLLGVALLRNNTSFPVGKVQTMNMYPMNFIEFLMANGRELLIDEIQRCYREFVPMNEGLHELALSLYRSYLVVGGMPKAVFLFTTENSYINACRISDQIYQDYLNDMDKYAGRTQALKNKNCYNSIANQLAKENKNFKYAEIEKGKDGIYFGPAIMWLASSRVVLQSYLCDVPHKPLSFHKNEFIFRLYLSDVGLMRYATGIGINELLDKDFRNDITGIITENYVACELVSYEIPLYYWKGKRQSEIEFLLEGNNSIIPLEVKTGIRTTTKSLDVYKENYSIDYAYKLSSKNFGYVNNIKSVPLYAVNCIAYEYRRNY